MKNFLQQCKDFGYKEVEEYLQGYITKEEMLEKIKIQTRRYAKRQLTWFRKYGDKAIWLDNNEAVEKNVKLMYECTNL